MTDIPLRDYLDRRLADLDDRITAILAEQDKRARLIAAEAQRALDKNEASIEKRLALLNEFRQQSQDEQRRFVTQEAFSSLKERVDKTSGGYAAVASATAVVIALAAIVAAFFH